MYFKSIPLLIRKAIPNAIWRIPAENTIFLSFDDGPHPESTPKILALLKYANAKASFFLLGSNAEKYPDLVDQIIKDGHTVAWHGYEHLNGWRTSKKVYLQNATRCKSIIKSKLFRPPFGRVTPVQFQALLKQFKIVMWSHMPGDFDNTLSTQQIKDRVAVIPANGSIVVLHDTPKSMKTCQIALQAIFQKHNVKFKKIEY